MAAKNEEWTEESAGAAANAATDSGWSDVSEEVKIDLETEGEGLTALYVGMDPPNANGITQAHFETVYSLSDEFIADRALMNAGRDLVSKLRKVPTGRQVRLQWVSSMNTGQISPMRVFKVQWR